MAAPLTVADDGSARVVGEVTVHVAAELRDALLALPPGEDARVVDVSGVTHVDAAGAQVLLAFARRGGEPVRFRGWQGAARAQLERVGLGPALGTGRDG